MGYPDNEENKKSKFGFIILLFCIVFVVGAVGAMVLLWSINPVLVFILIGIGLVLGVPAVAGIVLLVVIAECSGDWAGTHEYYDWSNMPALKDRWPKERL